MIIKGGLPFNTRGDATNIVAHYGALNFDHIGSKIGQDGCGFRSGQIAGKVDDSDSLKYSRHLLCLSFSHFSAAGARKCSLGRPLPYRP